MNGLLSDLTLEVHTYSLQKRPEPQNLSKICPSDCFWGSSQGVKHLFKICQNLSENYCFQVLTTFKQTFGPLTGTPSQKKQYHWGRNYYTINSKPIL